MSVGLDIMILQEHLNGPARSIPLIQIGLQVNQLIIGDNIKKLALKSISQNIINGMMIVVIKHNIFYNERK